MTSTSGLNYFTPESFRRLLEGADFKYTAMDGTFPAGRQLHDKRKRLETLLHQNGLAEFKRELYRFMIHKQIGREIVLYARKPRN